MEPPSSISTNRENIAGPHADDPLSCSLTPDSYLIVTRSADEPSEGGYVVCAYNARTGLSFIGTTGSIVS